MLCIWRGAPDWPEGPPSSGDLSSIQPTRGRHCCFQPDARARRPRGPDPVCGGNQPGPHPRSVWRPRWLGPTGWGRGAGWDPGEGRGAVGGGLGGMKLLQMLLRGCSRCHSLSPASQAGLRALSARQGSCLSCVRAGGGAWGPRRGADASRAGRGWEGEGTARERGGLALLESRAVTSAQKRKSLLASVHVGSMVCATQWAGSTETGAPAPALPLVAGSPWASHLTSLSRSRK